MPHQEFAFEFDRRYAIAALAFGVTPGRCEVTLTETELVVRFGWWRVQTPLANIASATSTGPYRLLKTAGPARLSLSDRGLTFATNPRRGVQLDFVEPVHGIDPAGLLKHPNLTVTVVDIVGLLAAVSGGPST